MEKNKARGGVRVSTKGTSRVLKMEFAGRFIDLLGQQMYGGPVPAVAELVSNAWDANSKKVEISIPKDPTATGAEIKVRDYGMGMTFDELNDYYLNIGYERRVKRGDRTPKPFNRFVMGRKGIGKLAGFGIAEDIVLRSVKEGHVVQFTLNYKSLREKKSLSGLQFAPEIDKRTAEPDGVTVTFRKLKLRQSINLDNFRRSMARKFAIGSDEMQVLVNGKPIEKDELEFEHRTPPGAAWDGEVIPGFGEVQFWFGFTKEPIQDSELRGITIFARNRVAQTTPFFFNLAGGINGQVGLEYLTGQVRANPLDEKFDCVATDRQSVNWQFEAAAKLEEWGKSKVKHLCAEWKKRRVQKKKDSFKHNVGQYNRRIEKLPRQEQEDLFEALGRIADMEEISPSDFDVIASSMIAGVERESVKKVIQRINVTGDSQLAELIDVIKEWDIIASVASAESITGKIGIIQKFEQYIDDRIPEKAGKGKLDMQSFIKQYPWLLGHEYENIESSDFHHEQAVDKWIQEVLNKVDAEFKRADKREGRRFDLLTIRNSHQIVILELMRPGEAGDFDHVMRLQRYVTRIEAFINDSSTDSKFQNHSVTGLLIAGEIAKDPSVRSTLITLGPKIEGVSWRDLFARVEGRYLEHIRFLAQRAPNDSRMDEFKKILELK